jgi:hypothetical protein
MKKSLLFVLSLIILGASSVQATDLRALNVQNAKMYGGEDSTELRVNFDWFRDHKTFGGGTIDSRQQEINFPRIDIRQSCTTSPIPFRVGLNTAITGASSELEANDNTFFERSALGFNNLGLTLEAGLVQADKVNITGYINQNFALVHNQLLADNQLRPITGSNAYGFQTGALYQFDLADSLTWYGDIGYRFDVPERGEVENSVVYYNEAVLALGSDDNFGLSVGLLGNSVYNNSVGTDLRLVPGLIVKVGEGQLRAGMPIALTSDTPDIGVQVGYFSMF